MALKRALLISSCPRIRKMTKRAAERVVRSLVREIGMGFHPDTPGREYVKQNGKRSFTVKKAKAIDCKVDFAFRLLGNKVYDIGLREQRKLLRRI
jgi:hypothetical protein